MLKKLSKKPQGFTIIEVLLVLAIAGVIMLVVFLAVPALQRSSRNTQRRSDASHMASLIDEYSANHTGQMPTTVGPNTACDVNTSTESFAIISSGLGSGGSCTGTNYSSSYTAPASPALDKWWFFSSTTCNNNSPASSTSPRDFTIVFYVEPGTTLQCVQV